MSEQAGQARYWNRFVTPDGTWRKEAVTRQPLLPPGEDLAAMRSGLGRQAVTVPKLWPFYTCPVVDSLAIHGQVSYEQEAEHAALALFGLHQQAQKSPMHRPGVGVGQALRALRQHDKFSEQAVDARVSAAVTATSVPVLLMRLRALITQLRTISQPLDYDLLLTDIERWHWPDARQRVRRAWGLGYYAWAQPNGTNVDHDS